MTASFANVAYLLASLLFVLSLRGLSTQESARRGNTLGVLGMILAVISALSLLEAAGGLDYVIRGAERLLRRSLEIEPRFGAALIQLAYALGFCFAGRLMDAIGVRRGLAISVTLWSLAAMAHGLAAWVPAVRWPMST